MEDKLCSSTALNHYVYTGYDQIPQQLSRTEKVANFFRHSYNASCFYGKMALHFPSYLWSPSPSYCGLETTTHHWQADNQGLAVFIMGYLGHVIWAAPYLSELQRERPDIEVRIPYVTEGGNCTLLDAATPIVNMVRDYIQHNPGKPVCLIGGSNGGRIAAKVAILLSGENVAIKVVGIASPFFGIEGTALRTLVRILHPTLTMHPAIIKDFQVGSSTSRTLIDELRSPPEQGERAYAFYGTIHDRIIPNFHSCFPLLRQGEHYHIITTGWGHMSLSLGVQPQVIHDIYTWIDSHPSL